MSWKVYNIFNEILLKPYYAPHYPHQKAIEEEKRNEQESKTAKSEYEVEDLLDSQINKKGWGCLKYLVKWKNYPREDASWEPRENLTNTQEIVEEFHKKFPNAPRWVRTNNLEFQRFENFTKPDIPKTLYGWEDGKFKWEYLEKLERQWQRWKQQGLLDDDSKFGRMQTLQRGWCYNSIIHLSPEVIFSHAYLSGPRNTSRIPQVRYMWWWELQYSVV